MNAITRELALNRAPYLCQPLKRLQLKYVLHFVTL